MRVRYQFLDLMRGIAACQVVALHYLSAFFPVTAGVSGIPHTAYDAWVRQSPFFLLFDGYSAVYVFFLISGFVLAGAFEKTSAGFLRQIFARFVRLFLPVAASAGISLLVIWFWPFSREAFFAASGSGWLNELLLVPPRIGIVAQDIALNSLILGYQYASLFGTSSWLSPINSALNPPLWTLHMELWGSLVLLSTCRLLARCSIVIKTAIILAEIIFIFGSSELTLFLVGYIANLWRKQILAAGGFFRIFLSFGLLATGGFYCTIKQSTLLNGFNQALNGIALLSSSSEFHFISSVGATLVFFGLIINPPIRKLLSTKLLQKLGSLSFSLYLIHFPIIALVAAPIFLWFLGPLSYGFASLLAGIIGFGLTVLIAAGYYKMIDLPALGLSRRIISGGKDVILHTRLVAEHE